MRRNEYRCVEYGGKHSGCTTYVPTSDELVLDREDIAYVLKALRRGTGEDKAFAKRMFDTLCPATRCECCGRRLVLVEGKCSCHKMGDRTLCYRCWFALADIAHCLRMPKFSYKEHPLDGLKYTQKAREDWCQKEFNYLVNEKTYDEWLAKYRSLFGTKDEG